VTLGAGASYYQRSWLRVVSGGELRAIYALSSNRLPRQHVPQRANTVRQFARHRRRRPRRPQASRRGCLTWWIWWTCWSNPNRPRPP